MIFAGFILIKTKKLSFRNFYTNFHRNFLALLSGTASQIMIQMASLPLFLNYLSIEKYAIWLLSYNVAQITGLLDFGSIAYSQNQISYLSAQKRAEEIDLHLKQIINLLAINSTIFILMISLLQIFGSDKFSATLIAVFVCSNILHLIWGLLEALTRIDSKIAMGLYTSNVLKLCEFLGTVVGVIIFSNNLLKVALISLVFKTIAFVFMSINLSTKYRFLRLGVINWNQILIIVRNGAPFFFIRVADMISLSGLLIVLHGKISANQFVLFVAARTFFRIGLQVTSLIAHSYSYEMSASWVSHDAEKMQRLIKRSNRINIILSTIGIVIYLAIGQKLFLYWVNEKIDINSQIVLWGACYSFILSVNQNQKTKFYAINHNFLVSMIQISYSITLVVMVAISKFSFSVVNLFILLSLFELLCYVSVAATSRNSINQYFQDLSSTKIINNSKLGNR